MYSIDRMSDAQVTTALTDAPSDSAILRPGSTDYQRDNGLYFSTKHRHESVSVPDSRYDMHIMRLIHIDKL